MTENKKKGFAALDVMIVFGAVLLVIGMIGQNLAVHYLDRRSSSEEFELSVLVRSYAVADAQLLLNEQAEAGENGLSCDYRDKTVCNVKNLHTEPIDGQESEGYPTLCRLTGVLSAKGYTEGENFYLYGYGEIAEDDILVLSVAGKTLSLEITKVNVKKIQKNT